jgi:hypothetical protein
MKLEPTSVQGLREVAAICHAQACAKGWWPRGTGVDAISTDEVLAKLALIHSEVSEALEVARDPSTKLNVQWEEGRVTKPDSQMPKPEGFGVELNDGSCHWRARSPYRQKAPHRGVLRTRSCARPSRSDLLRMRSRGQVARRDRRRRNHGRVPIVEGHASALQVEARSREQTLCKQGHKRMLALGKLRGVPVRHGTQAEADVVIRVFDLAGALGIDIAKCIEGKHAFNATRAQRHGGKRA